MLYYLFMMASVGLWKTLRFCHQLVRVVWHLNLLTLNFLSVRKILLQTKTLHENTSAQELSKFRSICFSWFLKLFVLWGKWTSLRYAVNLPKKVWTYCLVVSKICLTQRKHENLSVGYIWCMNSDGILIFVSILQLENLRSREKEVYIEWKFV